MAHFSIVWFHPNTHKLSPQDKRKKLLLWPLNGKLKKKKQEEGNLGKAKA